MPLKSKADGQIAKVHIGCWRRNAGMLGDRKVRAPGGMDALEGCALSLRPSRRDARLETYGLMRNRSALAMNSRLQGQAPRRRSSQVISIHFDLEGGLEETQYDAFRPAISDTSRTDKDEGVSDLRR